MLIEGRRLVERASRWLVRSTPSSINIARRARYFADGARLLGEALPDILGDAYPLGTAVTMTTYQLAQVVGFAAGGAVTGLAGPGAAPGSVAKDTLTIGNGGAGPVPTGSATFFLCGPGQSTAAGCPSGGSQVGASKTLTAGTATSDMAPAAAATGTYCWRAEYSPDAASQGVYAPSAHTNASSECFSVTVPGFPDTGRRQTTGPGYQLAFAGLLGLAAAGVGWRRRRRR